MQLWVTVALQNTLIGLAICGKNNDKIASNWIADSFNLDHISGRFIPPTDILQLRDLKRYYQKLVSFNIGEKN
jgi:hypothetical protein